MEIIEDERQTKFDVYAKPFIPQIWKDVNLATANVVACAPAPWINFDSFVQRFAGIDFLTANPSPVQTKAASNGTSSSTPDEGQSRSASYGVDTPSITTVSANAPLAFNNYLDYFTEALKQKASALHQECEDYALYNVPLYKASGLADPRPSMYRNILCETEIEFITDLASALHVPGLRELTLHIEIGDLVRLRQLRFDTNGAIITGSIIKDASGKSVKLGTHADTQHNSIVWGINRLQETLSLRIDSLTPRSMKFNVQFSIQSGRLGAAYRATIATHNQLRDSETGWTRSMLFPEEGDGYYQKTLNNKITNLNLLDDLLNYEQLKAVNTVLNETYGPVPYVISGPPGTGKTKTIVEIALQLVTKRENTHLLVCAPSDPAADTLIQRLSKHLKPSQLLRLNSPSRSFPETPNNVLPFCCIDNGMFSLPSFEQLMRLKIVVSTCCDAEILLRARLSNKDLQMLEQSLFAAIHPEASTSQPELHWTGLLMDEAAQATEVDALIPLSVVAPPGDCNLSDERLPLFVMAGDQHQLGPRTASKSPAIQTSLFERLLNRPFYCDHPLARSKQTGGVMRPLTQEMLPIFRPAFTNLIRNYRSHPAILATPSKLFYNDTLEPEATGTDALQSWTGWKDKQWPVLFSHNTSPDEIEQDGGGWYNLGEADMACDYALSFLQASLLLPHELCIMSPFRAQVRILRKLAREPPYSMSGVNIGPLEALQGLESRLVILCTTRTRDRFIDQDIAKGLGVIHEPKRFNVALTRAKEGLIVIGNPDVLTLDDNWKAFLSFCWRNGLCDVPGDVSLEPQADQVNSVSRLERRLLHETEGVNGIGNGARHFGLDDGEDAEMWRSGVAAEQAILDSDEEG